MELKRNFLFKCVVGSTLQNLRNENSDIDEKIFVMPNFNDLFNNKYFNDETITKENDEFLIDIRKLNDIFYKTSSIGLEILFSKDLTFNENLSSKSKEYLLNLFSMKEDIAKLNLKSLYYQTENRINRNKNLIIKPTPSKQYLFDEFGYNTKAAMQNLRLMDLLIKYKENNFTNMEDCLIYNNENNKFLLKVKNGEFTLEEYNKFFNKRYIEFLSIKEDFLNYPLNSELGLKVKELITNVFIEELKNNN